MIGATRPASRRLESLGMAEFHEIRRRILLAGAAGLFVPAAARAAQAGKKEKGGGAGEEKEVGAVEDLMREHGVLRRALLVYAETAPKLRAGGREVAADALNRTAKLFRAFGEDYHERKLEEAHIFPAVRKHGGAASALVDVLKAQHDRGREITDYVVAVTRRGSIGSAAAEPLAEALERFAVMYENHTAREDTVVFPAWQEALSEQQLHELGEQFEAIEKQQFGGDGYEDAVKQMAEIEQTLGLADLGQFTAPPPPRA